MDCKIKVLSEIMRVITPDFSFDSPIDRKYFFSLEHEQQNIVLYVIFLRSERPDLYKDLSNINNFSETEQTITLKLFEFGLKCWNGALALKETICEKENEKESYPVVILSLPKELLPYEDEIKEGLAAALDSITKYKDLSEKEKMIKLDSFIEDYIKNFIASLDRKSKSELH